MTGKDEAIRSAERTLAMRLPDDCAAWLGTNEGLERDLGGSYLSLYSVEELVERNHGYALAELLPGLILIGTDGGGEGIGLDEPPPRRRDGRHGPPGEPEPHAHRHDEPHRGRGG